MWYEALLVDDTLGHVGYLISMVKTVVEKVMVAKIGGLVRRQILGGDGVSQVSDNS